MNLSRVDAGCYSLIKLQTPEMQNSGTIMILYRAPVSVNMVMISLWLSWKWMWEVGGLFVVVLLLLATLVFCVRALCGWAVLCTYTVGTFDFEWTLVLSVLIKALSSSKYRCKWVKKWKREKIFNIDGVIKVYV